jgi:hypothetical protein
VAILPILVAETAPATTTGYSQWIWFRYRQRCGLRYGFGPECGAASVRLPRNSAGSLSKYLNYWFLLYHHISMLWKFVGAKKKCSSWFPRKVETRIFSEWFSHIFPNYPNMEHHCGNDPTCWGLPEAVVSPGGVGFDINCAEPRRVWDSLGIFLVQALNV